MSYRIIPKSEWGGRPARSSQRVARSRRRTFVVHYDGATPDELAETWLAAVRTAAKAHAEMTGAIIAASATTSERALADRLGVARDTVRKALGK